MAALLAFQKSPMRPTRSLTLPAWVKALMYPLQAAVSVNSLISYQLLQTLHCLFLPKILFLAMFQITWDNIYPLPTLTKPLSQARITTKLVKCCIRKRCILICLLPIYGVMCNWFQAHIRRLLQVPSIWAPLLSLKKVFQFALKWSTCCHQMPPVTSLSL